MVENLTIADFALCPSHLFLLISIFALTDFGNSRQSSLVPFVIARFYCIVSNAFKPYLTGVKNILKFLRHLIKKQGRMHNISCLPSLFLPAEKRGDGRTSWVHSTKKVSSPTFDSRLHTFCQSLDRIFFTPANVDISSLEQEHAEKFELLRVNGVL